MNFSPVWSMPPSIMLSSTVILDRALVSWNVRTMPRLDIRWATEPPMSTPLNSQVPVVGRVEAGEQVEQGGLAGPVGADQAGDHAPLDLEVVDVDGRQAAEAALHVVHHQDRVGLGHAGTALDVGQHAGLERSGGGPG